LLQQTLKPFQARVYGLYEALLVDCHNKWIKQQWSNKEYLQEAKQSISNWRLELRSFKEGHSKSSIEL
jgi:hypothetical protein